MKWVEKAGRLRANRNGWKMEVWPSGDLWLYYVKGTTMRYPWTGSRLTQKQAISAAETTLAFEVNKPS